MQFEKKFIKYYSFLMVLIFALISLTNFIACISDNTNIIPATPSTVISPKVTFTHALPDAPEVDILI